MLFSLKALESNIKIEANLKVAFFFAKTLKLPIIPIAHNAGKFWPKGMFGKKSGVITSRFLDPVNNFEDKNKLIKSLENNIYSSIL